MTIRLNFNIPIIIVVIIIVSPFYLTIQSQTSTSIPLEAFEGFKKDSFTLPGESIPQPVYKYGIYESKVTVTLDGVGKVYVHHVLYFDEEDYSYMEIYSRKPSSEFIQGIKRYGNFRMYKHRQFESDSDYSNKPRIEFVQGLNSITRTINPLSIYKISGANELKISSDNSGYDNMVTYEVKDFKKYVDPILYDSSNFNDYGPNFNFSGWIQYDLESDLIIVSLIFFAWEDVVLGTFESVIYDSHGILLGHVTGYGPLGTVTITANHQYLYTNTGGQVTEDYNAPYIFRIFDLKTGEIKFLRRSTTNELSGFAIPHSNLGVYIVSKPFGGEFSEIESYIIDHDKGIMYMLHLNPLCHPPSHTSFYPTYCECYMENGLKSKITYDRDLTAIKFN